MAIGYLQSWYRGLCSSQISIYNTGNRRVSYTRALPFADGSTSFHHLQIVSYRILRSAQFLLELNARPFSSVSYSIPVCGFTLETIQYQASAIMASITPPQILLTGATGFIGGTILTHLLNSSSPTLSAATITCLVRGSDRASTLSSAYGTRVRPVLYNDLDDTSTTSAVAAEHDVVISATVGYHPGSAHALLHGLAQRKARTGRDVWMLQISGTSNLGEQRISGAWVEADADREFDDARDDIYGYERMREALHPYLARATELGLVDAGRELGVTTVVMMPPLVFGVGTGLFNKISVQIPTYIRGALSHGRAVVVGDGNGVMDHVHVEDLAELYTIAVLDVLDNGGKSLPTGKEGIIFSGNGRHTWMEVAQGVADVLYEEGKIRERQVESVGLAEGTEILHLLGWRDDMITELGLSSTARTVPTLARRLGWKPTRGKEAWRKAFREDVKAVLEKE